MKFLKKLFTSNTQVPKGPKHEFTFKNISELNFRKISFNKINLTINQKNEKLQKHENATNIESHETEIGTVDKIYYSNSLKYYIHEQDYYVTGITGFTFIENILIIKNHENFFMEKGRVNKFCKKYNILMFNEESEFLYSKEKNKDFFSYTTNSCLKKMDVGLYEAGRYIFHYHENYFEFITQKKIDDSITQLSKNLLLLEDYSNKMDFILDIRNKEKTSIYLSKKHKEKIKKELIKISEIENIFKFSAIKLENKIYIKIDSYWKEMDEHFIEKKDSIEFRRKINETESVITSIYYKDNNQILGGFWEKPHSVKRIGNLFFLKNNHTYFQIWSEETSSKKNYLDIVFYNHFEENNEIFLVSKHGSYAKFNPEEMCIGNWFFRKT